MAEIAVEATHAPAQLPQVRVAVLGAGKMGGILLQAFLKAEPVRSGSDSCHRGTTPNARWRLSTQWGVDVSTNNLEAAGKSDLILMGGEAVPGAGSDRGDSPGADARPRRWCRLPPQ